MSKKLNTRIIKGSLLRFAILQVTMPSWTQAFAASQNAADMYLNKVSDREAVMNTINTAMSSKDIIIANNVIGYDTMVSETLESETKKLTELQEKYIDILKKYTGLEDADIRTLYVKGNLTGKTAKDVGELIKDKEILKGLKEVSKGVFKDIKGDEWYVENVVLANALGIVNGYPDGTFRAEDKVNRAEYLTMLRNIFLGYTGLENVAQQIRDGNIDFVGDYKKVYGDKFWYENQVVGFSGEVFANGQYTANDMMSPITRYEAAWWAANVLDISASVGIEYNEVKDIIEGKDTVAHQGMGRIRYFRDTDTMADVDKAYYEKWDKLNTANCDNDGVISYDKFGQYVPDIYEVLSGDMPITQQYILGPALAQRYGIIGGHDDGKFAGQDSLTRAEATVIVNKLAVPIFRNEEYAGYTNEEWVAEVNRRTESYNKALNTEQTAEELWVSEQLKHGWTSESGVIETEDIEYLKQYKCEYFYGEFTDMTYEESRKVMTDYYSKQELKLMYESAKRNMVDYYSRDYRTADKVLYNNQIQYVYDDVISTTTGKTLPETIKDRVKLVIDNKVILHAQFITNENMILTNFENDRFTLRGIFRFKYDNHANLLNTINETGVKAEIGKWYEVAMDISFVKQWREPILKGKNLYIPVGSKDLTETKEVKQVK